VTRARTLVVARVGLLVLAALATLAMFVLAGRVKAPEQPVSTPKAGPQDKQILADGLGGRNTEPASPAPAPPTEGPPADEPTHGNDKPPAGGEDPPAGDETAPANSDATPTHGDDKPPAGDEAPSPDGEATPTHGNDKPPAGDEAPPSDDGATPTHGGDETPPSDGESTPTAGNDKPSPAGDKAPPTPVANSPVDVDGAADYVRAFYADLSARRFRAAWPRLADDLRKRHGSFEAWKRGFATTLRQSASEISAKAAGPATVRVSLTLTAVDRDKCKGEITRRFAVLWRLDEKGGEWDATHAEAKAIKPAPTAVTATCSAK
jgi:hypothetical protein